ncbi:MAG: organic hydroperoxide resistance protein [Planctomycetes bacterium]|nr:organic hydroperoxide resistance protein [Planctomycetota bacterium]
MALDTVLYSTEVTVTGGRDGKAVSADGNLQVSLSMPKALGGPGGEGTNPEQLFAAGYAACFLSALKLVAGQRKVLLSREAAIRAETRLGKAGDDLQLAVTLAVSLPGMDKATAEELVAQAHRTCPYSRATRNNIDVTITVTV